MEKEKDVSGCRKQNECGTRQQGAERKKARNTTDKNKTTNNNKYQQRKRKMAYINKDKEQFIEETLKFMKRMEKKFPLNYYWRLNRENVENIANGNETGDEWIEKIKWEAREKETKEKEEQEVRLDKWEEEHEARLNRREKEKKEREGIREANVREEARGIEREEEEIKSWASSEELNQPQRGEKWTDEYSWDEEVLEYMADRMEKIDTENNSWGSG